ncbi:MAG: hypothetical protein DHS80DRAFT_23102 [Piptocephalis tieghemiana]|nr:MAG: hypothetical protein DHS80DRAFT_23102 [Piptocephalis tieghemiana]
MIFILDIVNLGINFLATCAFLIKWFRHRSHLIGALVIAQVLFLILGATFLGLASTELMPWAPVYLIITLLLCAFRVVYLHCLLHKWFQSVRGYEGGLSPWSQRWSPRFNIFFAVLNFLVVMAGLYIPIMAIRPTREDLFSEARLSIIGLSIHVICMAIVSVVTAIYFIALRVSLRKVTTRAMERKRMYVSRILILSIFQAPAITFVFFISIIGVIGWLFWLVLLMFTSIHSIPQSIEEVEEEDRQRYPTIV